MKRYLFWIITLLFTFLLGVIFTILIFTNSENANRSKNEKLFENLPVLSYCEVSENPDKYDGKIIRLKTMILGSLHHGEYISAGYNCRGDIKMIGNSETTAALLYIDSFEQKKVSDIRSQRKNTAWSDPLTFVGVGKFSKNEPEKDTDSIKDNSPYHFTIISIDAVIDDSASEPEMKTEKFKSVFIE